MDNIPPLIYTASHEAPTYRAITVPAGSGTLKFNLNICHFLCCSQNVGDYQVKFRRAAFQDWPKWSEVLHLKQVGKITPRKIIMAWEVPIITLCITKFNTQKKIYILPAHCIYVLCADLRTNSNYFSIQHWYVRTQRTVIFKETEAEREKRWTSWKTATKK